MFTRRRPFEVEKASMVVRFQPPCYLYITEVKLLRVYTLLSSGKVSIGVDDIYIDQAAYP